MIGDIDWSSGAPRSRRFDDIYFSPDDGLDETRAVFLDGCGMPGVWADRNRFVVGELGFGTGLNLLALLDLWARTRPSEAARLHVFSVESHPLTREEAARALAAFPEVAELAAGLLRSWPCARRGWRRLEWPELGATLDLAVLDVAEALQAWTGRADAWFLDGFAPSRNPAMWSEPVLAAVAARSTPGARAATFTVAGAVRRGLEAAGFSTARRPGYGLKRQRLEARLGDPSVETSPRAPPTVAIVGGGVAGAALVRACRRAGLAPTLIEACGVGAGASGAAAALVAPRLDAGFGPGARLHAQAFGRAVALIDDEAPAAVISRGALQLQAHTRDATRFAAIAGWDGFDAGALEIRGPDEVAASMGEATAPGALWSRDARVVEPAALLETWLADAPRLMATVGTIEKDADHWRLLDAEGATIARTQVVILAAGAELPDLVAAPGLRRVRGQLETVDGVALGGPAVAWGGYAIPTRAGVLYGATHVRDDADVETRSLEAAANLEALTAVRPALAARLSGTRGASAVSRAAVRLTTPDHLPIAGEVPGMRGVLVLGALGGRGFTLAPLLAEHLAAMIADAPSPLPAEAQALIDPSRRGWLDAEPALARPRSQIRPEGTRV